MPEAGTVDNNQGLVDLLHGCAQGRQAALRALYDALAPQLFPLLVRILKRNDLAEEAVQETFISVWRNAAEYTAAKGSVRTWVLSIGRYRALDLLRHERREVHWEPADVAAALDDDDAGSERDLISHAEQRALQDCLAELSEGQRNSLRLAYFYGQSHEEIATTLRSPIGTIKSWVRRGLTSLKRCLER